MIQMVDLLGQYKGIQADIDQALIDTVRSGAFVGGAAVAGFAQNLAHYLHTRHVVPCANGTDALQIALMSLGLERGDEVITSAFTFVATGEVIALLGLKPVFIDIDPHTYNIDATLIEQAISSRTRCILPVHLYGQSADMQPILDIAQRHQLYVVEDNAQAIGADYHFADGRSAKTGTIGNIGCTSFYPSKNLGCYGDGGALFANDDILATKIRAIANHGQLEKYVSHLVGVNSRLDTLQAVVLDIKLRHLDAYIAARQEAAAYYDQAFADCPHLHIPHRAAYSSHVFHQYTLRVNKAIERDLLKEHLAKAGIPSMIYYPVPMHLQPAYSNFDYSNGDLPHTEQAAQQVISLPMHTELNSEQLDFICQKVLDFWR